LILGFDVKRKPRYYITNVFAICALLIAMGWGIFIIPPLKLDARLAYAIVLFLSVLALNLVITSIIPRVSYGTKLSAYFNVAYIATAFGVFQSIASFLVSNYANICAAPAPAANATAPTPSAMDAVGCTAALYFDYATVCLLAVFEIIYTIVFLVKGTRPRPGEKILTPKHVEPPAGVEYPKGIEVFRHDAHAHSH